MDIPNGYFCVLQVHHCGEREREQRDQLPTKCLRYTPRALINQTGKTLRTCTRDTELSVLRVAMTSCIHFWWKQENQKNDWTPDKKEGNVWNWRKRWRPTAQPGKTRYVQVVFLLGTYHLQQVRWTWRAWVQSQLVTNKWGNKKCLIMVFIMVRKKDARNCDFRLLITQTFFFLFIK